MFNKSLTSIIAGFDKVRTDLGALMDRNEKRRYEITDAVVALTVEKDGLVAEDAKALKILQNLSALLAD